MLSGTVGVGDDEGFIFTGPDQLDSEASLFLAVDSTVQSLITLDDADLVNIEHLTLSNALHGLSAVNDSTGVVVSKLKISGHAGDGIRIETGSFLVSGTQIDSSGNAGHGIFSEEAVAILSNITANNNALSGVTVAGASDRVEDVQVNGNGESGLVIIGVVSSVQRVIANSNAKDGIFIQSPNVELSSSETVMATGTRLRTIRSISHKATESRFSENRPMFGCETISSS